MQTHPKVTQQHLHRKACLYVRQSSLHQVENHTESTFRQYDLKKRAVALGWSQEQIDIIDEDQGKSGATSEQRNGFQDVRARVGAGEVGLILCLEVSRLCRNNAAWHPLLRIAMVPHTLILDEQGVYDIADNNDGMLLGMKGQMSEYELRGMRQRMIGGQRSKAQRGELKMLLPTGLVYTETDQVVKDPDRSIAEAIDLVFCTFRRLKSAMQVTKWFLKQDLRLPSRLHTKDRTVVWSIPNHSQILRILHHPRYAGCYTYGRRRQKVRPDGTMEYATVPMDQWMVCLPKAHQGYMDWEEYLRNQEIMRNNVSSFLQGAERIPSPRKGKALLQSRIVCGICGHRMRVYYGNKKAKKEAYYYQCKERIVRHGKNMCQSIRGDVLDEAVGHFVIAAVHRKNLALTFMVQQHLRHDFEAGDQQRKNPIEALKHQMDVARRRYMAVDPTNRLVAATLEAQWETQLKAYDRAVQEHQSYREIHSKAIDTELEQRILDVTKDFAKVWHASQTSNEDRKRLLGLLVEDITLTRNAYQAIVQLRLRGGHTHQMEPVELPLPRAIAIRRDVSPQVLQELENLLAQGLTDALVAQELHRRGHRDSLGEKFHARRIQSIRKRNRLAGGRQQEQDKWRAKGYKTGNELAAELGISYTTLKKRVQQKKGIEKAPIAYPSVNFAMYKISDNKET